MWIAERPVDAPQPNPETAQFWEATRADIFLLRWCLSCGRTHWFPRPICPHCRSLKGEWREASGRGSICSYSVIENVERPYVAALVTLEEGPTMISNIIHCETERLAIGKRVKLAFVSAEGGAKLPLFRPVQD